MLFTGVAAFMTWTQFLLWGVGAPFVVASAGARWWPWLRHKWQVGEFVLCVTRRSMSGKRLVHTCAPSSHGLTRPTFPQATTAATSRAWHMRDKGAAAEWDAEYVAAFSRDQERARGRQQQQQQTWQQQWQQQWHQQWQRQWQQRARAGRGQQAGARSGPAPGAGAPPSDPLGYYARLGVKPGASTSEIQAAFRGLALQHHPDRYTAADEKTSATKRFQQITEAYQVLRDANKRREYDAGQYRA